MRIMRYILILVVLSTFPLLLKAQDTVVSDTVDTTISRDLETSDVVSNDVDSVPEWYIPAEIPIDLRAPMRASAAGCLTDSILTFNQDSVLTEATTYDYDAAGRTIRTTVWQYNADGSRTGKSKQEYAFDANGTQIYTGTFAWDATTNDWKGTAKSEYVYNEAHKMESNITYIWVNNTWLPSQALTYAYDAAGRETEFTTYARNASLNRLVPSKCRLRTYEGSKVVSEINYTTYANGAWTKGNRKDYTFDADGHQIAYYYLTGISNAEFVPASGSTYELKGYDDNGNNNTYEKCTWASNNWKGSSRWERVFDRGEETLYISYKWSNNAWVYNTRSINEFDELGNQIEEASYTWTGNKYWKGNSRTTTVYDASGHILDNIVWAWSLADTAWVGSERIQRIYSGSRLTQTLRSVWTNGEWCFASKDENHYTASGQRDTTASYTWNATRNAWDGVARTYNINSSGTTITVNDSWNIDHWQMSSMSRTETLYDGAKRKILTASYTCGPDTVWKGSNKTEYDYTATGKNLETRYYGSFADGNWIQSYRIEYGYDAADHKILEQKWTLSGATWKGTYRYEYAYNAAGTKYLDATYNSWNATLGIWVGRTKTEKIYDTGGHQIGLITYTWSTTINDWIGSYRYSYEYDSSNREVSQVVENYDATNAVWVNNTWYEKEYLKNKQVTANQYTWRGNRWCFVARSEKYYDADKTTLRREITGDWSTSGELNSFTDVHYFYSCDAPTDNNGAQPRTPTELEEIDENNGNYENDDTNVQPFDPTQPAYNLSGQRVEPGKYKGVVVQNGKKYILR